MRIFYIFILLIPSFLFGQTIANFEQLPIPANGFLNGSEGAAAYESGNVSLPTNFQGTFWTGWAVSSVIDTENPSFMNQYASITGGGAEGSSNYAVCYLSGSVMRLTNDAVGDPVNGMYLTNGTYPYLVMRDGNNFSKRFGGEFGDDPDFFLLTIKGMLNGEVVADSINFYLADYRFTDNSMDYILDEWTYVNTTSLGPVDSLVFSFSGSDNDPMFGLNTPAYVLIDNVETSDATVATINRELSDQVLIYPNPVRESLNVQLPTDLTLEFASVIDLTGREILRALEVANLKTAGLVSGVYTLRLVTSKGLVVKRFLKG